MPIPVKFTFDYEDYRHFMDGHPLVIRGHHYLPLMAKAAIDFDHLGAIALQKEEAEKAMRTIFDDAIKANNISTPEDRLDVGVTYYPEMWLGRLQIVSAGPEGGEIVAPHSHLDEGWTLKWGQADRPVNFFTCGFIAAMFACAFDKPQGSYKVEEVESLAMGAAQSRFRISAN